MREFIQFVFLFFLGSFLQGQDIRVYGFLPVNNPNADYVLLAGMDPVSGQVMELDSVRPISGYALGSSAYDSYNRAFTFIGVDTDYTFRLVSRSIPADSTLWAPSFGETINDLQHDMNSLQLYGLGNYPNPTNAGDWALRFLRIDPQTGVITELNRMPEATAYPAGSSTFDANSGRYIIHIIDTNFVSHLYAIDAENGDILSDAVFNLPPNTDILNLEYNNRDNKVYGLFRNIVDNFFAVASLDIETASISDTVFVINDLQYFVQGSSVFHQMSQTYMLYYIDNNNNSRLLSVNVAEGGLVANPVIVDYFTELEIDNYDFAMMAYHGTTGLGEVKTPKHNDLVIFPNPSTGSITLEFTLEAEGSPLITITDVRGTVVRQMKADREMAGTIVRTIGIDDLPAGIYLLHVMCNNIIMSDRLVISK